MKTPKKKLLNIDSILNPIREFIKKEELFVSDTSKYQRCLDENYPEWSNQNEIVAKEFIDLVDNNISYTLKIIDRGIEGFGSLYSLHKHKDFVLGKAPSLGEQIEILASLFENIDAIKFTAFLLSNKNQLFENLTKKEQILKHFQILGFTKNDRKNFRLIRNAANHKLVTKEDYILLKDGNKINLSEVEKLYQKVQKLFNYSNSILFHSILHIPKFPLYTIVVFFNNGKKNTEELESVKKGFEKLYPKKEEEKNENRKQKSIIEKIKDGVSNFVGSIISKLIFRRIKAEEPDVFTPDNLTKYLKLVNQIELEIERTIKVLSSNKEQKSEKNTSTEEDVYINYFSNTDEILTAIKDGLNKEIHKYK